VFRGYRLRRHHALLALLLLTVIAALLAVVRPRSEHEVYIALFDRARNTPFAAIHRHALERYLRSLSEEVPGYRFELRAAYLDDPPGPADSPAALQRLYQEIADDDSYVLVIDNTWARHLQAAGGIIKQNRIPTLSLNADKGRTDFGHHAIFIGPADNTPLDLVTYINEVLRPETVAFIGEGDYWLTQEFLDLTGEASDQANRPLLRLDHRAIVATAATTENERRLLHESLTAWFDDDAPRPAVLLLNVHNDWGDEIIDYVDRELTGVTVLAASYAIREGKSATFQGIDGNRLILMTEPEDAISKPVHDDIFELHQRHPTVFDDDVVNLAYYVKRCLDASEIIREAVLGRARNTSSKTPPGIERDLFSNFFRDQLIGRAVAGRYDLYNFDSEGLVIPEISFVEYRHGVATSQWQQLNSRRQVIPTVFFGFDLLDIGRLDPENGRFRADFYYWIHAPSPDESGIGSSSGLPTAGAGPIPSEATLASRSVSDFIHFRNLSEENSRTLIDTSSDYRLQRISGEFNVDLELKDYPLDTQELTLELELANPVDDVRIAFDHAAFDNERNVEISDIPGWKLLEQYVTVDNVISRGLRGASPGQSREPKKFKTLTVRIVTQRKIQGALVAVALPLCAIGFAALSLLFIRDVRFSRVGDVYVGLFLSIVTYSIAFAQITPPSGVLTRADYLFYFTFMVVLLVFLRFVLLNALGRTTVDEAARPRRTLGYGAVGVYVVALLLLTFL
jgi:hypothetical protein